MQPLGWLAPRPTTCEETQPGFHSRGVIGPLSAFLGTTRWLHNSAPDEILPFRATTARAWLAARGHNPDLTRPVAAARQCASSVGSHASCKALVRAFCSWERASRVDGRGREGVRALWPGPWKGLFPGSDGGAKDSGGGNRHLGPFLSARWRGPKQEQRN